MMKVVLAAWLDIRSKPLRTLAAMAGVLAAVIAVVVVDAAAELSQEANAEYIARRWGRNATLRISGSDFADSLSPYEIADARQRLSDLLAAHGVTLISPRVEVGMALVRGSTAVPAYAAWVASAYPQVGLVDLQWGMFPRETARSDVLHGVISASLAERLGLPGASALGTVIGYALADGYVPDLRTAILRPIVIDGVARFIGTSDLPSDLVVVSDLPQPIFQARGGWTLLVHVHPRDARRVVELTQKIRGGNDNVPVFVARRLDQGEDLAPLLEQQGVTARAVTVVALAVGGLGILGVGLASVRERGKDFGLRRALGASKQSVFADVIVQTLLEVLLAATVALPLAALIVALFARQLVLSELPLPSSTALPLSSAVRGVLLALATGLLAGLLPAIRAARASVVQALRD